MIQTASRSKQLRLLAALLSVAAGAIHVMVVPDHAQEWWGYGTFFAVAAMAQGVYGIHLAFERWAYKDGVLRTDAERRGWPHYLVGLVANTAIIGLYAITRTAGIPFFGPEAGEVEDIGTSYLGIPYVDIPSKITEIALILCLFVLLLRSLAASRAPMSALPAS